VLLAEKKPAWRARHSGRSHLGGIVMKSRAADPSCSPDIHKQKSSRHTSKHKSRILAAEILD